MARIAKNCPSTEVRTLSPADHALVLSRVILSPVVKGPIIRRPRAVGLAERFDIDSAGVTEMQRLRDRYGSGPVQLRIPGRRFALILDPDDVHRVLNESPDTFTPASREKRGALNHFEPHGVLVSTAQKRAIRRPFNEKVLETGTTVHSHAEAMTAAIREEVDRLLGHVDFTGVLDWDSFAVMWWRVIRRIVLGNGARDDEQVSDDLRRLRQRGNFSYLTPQSRRLRARYLNRLRYYIKRAEPGSLAEMVAHTPAEDGLVPEQQIPQWMFAYDAATWASFRALSLVTGSADAVSRARDEMAHAPNLPYLRSAVLESLRLWPTTPLILRDSTTETTWSSGTLPAGTGVVIFAPFFHRDDKNLADAHRFNPEIWLRNRDDTDWPLVPFSGGPAMCPGRNVVLLTASMILGELLRHRDFTANKRLNLEKLPGTLSPFSSQFDVHSAGQDAT